MENFYDGIQRAKENRNVHVRPTVIAVQPILSKMANNSCHQGSGVTGSLSDGASDVRQEQVIPSSSCIDVITFSSEMHRINSRCARMLATPEIETFNGACVLVDTVPEDQNVVLPDPVCIEALCSYSIPENHIASLVNDCDNANINYSTRSAVSNVNTVVREEVVEIPLAVERYEVSKKSIEHVPLVAGECVVETDHVPEVSQCITIDNNEKKGKQPVSGDTCIRRSSRIAQKKNQKHQKNLAQNSKIIKDGEVKGKLVDSEENKKASSLNSGVSKGSKHYSKEKCNYRSKSKSSCGNGDKRDYLDKTGHGSDDSDRHDSKRSEYSKRENDGQCESNRKNSNKPESHAIDCDKEGNGSFLGKDGKSKGDCKHKSKGQLSHSNRRSKSKTCEIKNACYKQEEPHFDDQQKQKLIDLDNDTSCDNAYADLPKCKGKFVVPLKPNGDSDQTSSSSMEVRSVVSEDIKPLQKKLINNHNNSLKPEKVKSRWYRNSELEYGVFSSATVTGFPDSVYQKNPEASQRKESLPPVAEELPSSNICSEKLANSEENREKPPYYEPVEDNIYLFERKKSKSKKEVRRMVCDCTLTEEEKECGEPGCRENCLNRLLMIECGSRCAAGDLCSNKRFQKKQFTKTEPFKTEKKGWGLRVSENVAAGTFVMEYIGEVLSPQDFKQRVKQYAKEKKNHYYFMALKCDQIIDATNKGNLSRFINHSCDPSCETQKWTVNGELRIGFFTRRFIKAGEELTFDYQFQRYGREAQKCFCASESCRGYIGDDKQISLDNISSSKNSGRRKKPAAEKKREVLEDLSIEEELEKLQVSKGLRNRQETLVLARLMVRAEDAHTRNRLLDIILNTTEQPCLRLFLDYHGLSLMWSWMVDVADLKLKTKILRALSFLPIPNKTMLLDSKVINVVQKWRLYHSGRKSELDKECEVTETEQSSDSPSGGTTPCGGDDNHGPSSRKSSESSDTSSESDSSISPYLQLRVSDSVMFPTSSITTVHIKTSDNDCTPAKNDNVEQKANHCIIIGNTPEHQTSQIMGASSYGENVISDAIKPVDTVLKSDDESGDTMDEEEDRKNDTELSNFAAQLLKSWSGLKEVFRIPRVEQQKRREDEDAVDHRNRERVSSRFRDYGAQEHCSREKDILKHRDGQDSDPFSGKDKKHGDRWRDRENTKSADYHHERNITESCEWHDEKLITKHLKKKQRSEPEVQQLARPRKFLLPTPPRLTKEQRRQHFALEVQQKDQEEALRKQQEEQTSSEVGHTATEPANFSTCNQYYAATYNTSTYPNPYDPNMSYPQQLVPDCQTRLDFNMTAHEVALPSEPKPNILPSTRTALLPTPTFVEPALHPLPLPVPAPQYPDQSSHLSYPPPGLLLPPPTQMPFLGPPPSLLPQPAPILTAAPSGSTLPPVTTPAPGMSLLSHASDPLNVLGGNHNPPAITSPSAVPITTVPPSAQPETRMLSASAIRVCASPAGSASDSTALPTASLISPGFLPNPAQFVNTSNRPVYFVHSSSTTSVVNVRDQIAIQQAIPVAQLPSVAAAEGEFSSPLVKPSFVRLPPNWKTARDPEGNVYYYHSITRQTQWDPPTLEENEDMDLGTPTFDEPKQSKKKSTTTAAADTSSELVKKIKELFRAKMSTFIVQFLNPYRKPDCQIGRIIGSDDFKHLARKLTHSVMTKELKHCKNVEDLECSENVKMKAKDFVQKYMAKQGPVYKKESSSKCN